MMHTVTEIADTLGLSKQTIYVKLRLKELKRHITKKQGVTYIDEDGFNLIKSSLKGSIDDLRDVKDKESNTTTSEETATDKEDMSVKMDYINLLKDELKEKNLQIQKLHVLLENSQVLLKNKTEEVKLLQVEEEVTGGFFSRMFKK